MCNYKPLKSACNHNYQQAEEERCEVSVELLLIQDVVK